MNIETIFWIAIPSLAIIFLLICWTNIAFQKKIKYIPIEPIENFSEKKEHFENSTVNFVKEVPNELKTLFSIVCSGFPELQKEDITLEFRKIRTTMQAIPKLHFVIGIRKYSVIINNNNKFKGVKFDTIPFNAKVGIVAHEFSHLLDYQQKTSCEILKTGILYLFSSGRKKYEKQIDTLTVNKGFGYQLQDWSKYAILDSDAPLDYKEFKKETYLSPEEISKIMKKTHKMDSL